MAHFQANLRKLSHSAVEMASLIQRTPSSSLSSSFHPCSAYPLSSNLVLLCRWWTGAIIRSLRLTLEQNVRQFKAACQSAFCTDSPPELPGLFIAYIANWGAQRQRQRKKDPTHLWITLSFLHLFRVLNYVNTQYSYTYTVVFKKDVL